MGQAVAGPASIGGAGLQAYSQILGAQGQKAGADYRADTLDRAAEYGGVKAEQTSDILTKRLTNTLGNIDTIRAAAHDDMSSPTGQAFRAYQEDQGNYERDIAVNNIVQDAKQKQADAQYLRKAGADALLAGYVGAAGKAIGAVGTGAGQSTFGIPNKMPFAPDDI